jgi:hypothetical protein
LFLDLEKDSKVWWCMPVIPELGRLMQEDQEFKASLGYIARLVMLDRIMTPHRYPHPNSHNLGICCIIRGCIIRLLIKLLMTLKYGDFPGLSSWTQCGPTC